MRLIKEVFYWMIAAAAFLVIAAGIITYFYGNEVKHYIVNELNKSIRIKVQVKDVEFTVLRYFPNASITFKEVYARNVVDDDTLCNARHISLLFNLKDIFYKNYTIRRIYIYDGTLKLAVDEAGNKKFNFWDSETKSSKKFAIKLSLLKIEKMHLAYENRALRRSMQTNIGEALLSGSFSDKENIISTSIKGIFNSYKAEDITFIKNKLFDLKLKFASSGSSYSITDGSATLAGISLSASGAFIIEEGHTNMSVSIATKGFQLDQIKELLPSKYFPKMENLKYGGTVKLSLRAKGILSTTQIPSIDAEFNLANGSITLNDKSKTKLSEISFSGAYTNHAEGVKELVELKNASVKIANSRIKGELSVSDLKNPYLKTQFSGTVPINALLAIAGQKDEGAVSGSVAINAALEGTIERLKKPANYGGPLIKLKTQVELRNIGLYIKKTNTKLNRVNGFFQNEGGSIVFRDLNGVLDGSDFLTSGTVENLIPWIFNDSIPLSVSAKLFAHTLDFNKILFIKPTSKKDSIGSSHKFNFKKIELNLNLANLYYKKIDVKGMLGNVLITPNEYKFTNVSFGAMNGNVKVDNLVISTTKDSSAIRGNAIIKGVNIKEMFSRLNNFEQTTLTDANINGNLTATVSYAVRMNNKGRLSLHSLEMLSDVTIENGELKNFKPVMDLSKHVKLKELEDVKFSTLKNEISIKNNVITIPEMEISSNAINLKASGTHSFDDQIDYKLQLRLSELLGRKVQQQNTEFGEIQSEGGRTTLFIRMYGDMHHPIIALDKAAVKKKIARDIKGEWQSLKNIFKKEVKSQEEKPTAAPTTTNPLEKEIDLNAEKKPVEKANATSPKRKSSGQKLKDLLKGNE